MRLTLKQLQYFDALARQLHFGRAAELCAVSQPALSVQIKELEATLGVQLIERAHSGVRLTREGEEVALRAARLITEALDLEASVGAAARGGIVRLGVIPTIAPYLLPDLLKAAAHATVPLSLHVRESQTARLIAALQQGDLDVLLLALPVEQPGLTSRFLFDDPFLLATPSAMPLKAPVAVRALPKFRLLLLEEGHCLRDQALAVCETAGRASLQPLGASSLATLIELVAAGQGVTLLPRLCAAAISADPRLALVPLGQPAPSRRVGLVWRQSSARGGLFETIAGLIEGVVAR